MLMRCENCGDPMTDDVCLTCVRLYREAVERGDYDDKEEWCEAQAMGVCDCPEGVCMKGAA